jgi:hypothetical protein
MCKKLLRKNCAMKVIQKNIHEHHAIHDEVLDVYDFYTDGHRKYFVVSPPSCGGLKILEGAAVKILDSYFSHDYVDSLVHGFYGKRHCMLKDDELYQGLLAHDSESYETFIEGLGGRKNNE